jgi:hypothetical protein
MLYSTISGRGAGDISSWLLRRSPAQCAAVKTIEFDCTSTVFASNPAVRFSDWLSDNVAGVKLQGLESIIMTTKTDQRVWDYQALDKCKKVIEDLVEGIDVEVEYVARD